MKLIVKKSNTGGNGVFAFKDIKKGELIYTLSGEVINEKQFLDRLSKGSENYDDPFQIYEGSKKMDRKYIDLDELSRTFNHSCDPNAGIRNISDLIAIRDIKVDEEITYDYSTTVGKLEDEFSMKCFCGSSKCRKIIGNITTIPPKQIDYYRNNGVLPDYIKDQL